MPKLTQYENEDRKMMKREATTSGVTVQHHEDAGVTLVFKRENKMVRVTWAICSDEEKDRRKVGEYVALTRWFSGEILPFPSISFVPEYLAADLSLGSRNEKGYIV